MATIVGKGAPTSKTIGILGQKYLDKDTKKEYVCKNVKYITSPISGRIDEECEWAEAGSGGGLASLPWGYETGGEALLDIQWDGTLTGKELIEFEPGAGYGLVKLSDAVLTEEQLKGCFFGFAGEETGGVYQEVPLSENGVLQDDPTMGSVVLMPYIWAIYDPAALNSAAAADGMNLNLTPGVYTMYQAGVVTDWHLWSDTVMISNKTIVPFPNKYMSFLDVTEETVIPMEEQTVTTEHKEELIEDGLGVVFFNGCTLPVLLTPGKTYRVVYDGVEYTLTDRLAELLAEGEEYGAIYSGLWSNSASTTSIESGEFALANFRADLSGVGLYSTTKTMLSCHEDDFGEHTIAIYDEVPKIKETVKVKKEAMPDDFVSSPIYTEAVAAEIIPEQELTDTNYGATPTNWIQKPLGVGYEYAVVIDGTTYNCVSTTNAMMNALYNEEVVLIGNASLHPYVTVCSLPNTGEPFLVMVVEDGSCLVLASVKNTAFTIQVSGYYANHHLIPYKYMQKPLRISVALESIPNLTGDERSAAIAELYAAEKALKNGVEVYAGYDSKSVQLTSMNINEMDSMYAYYNVITKDGWQIVDIFTSQGGHSMTEKSNALSCGLVTDHIILKSSTSGSTKKFKVTIDDAGQLIPTEIT